MSIRQGQSTHSQLPVTSLYRKLEVVGKGAYGAVYKGLHIPTNTIVAIKIIDLDTADDDTADIQREVSLLSQLRAENNNITKYYGCWLDGPRVWIVMDFFSGGSVRTLMKSVKGGVLEERWIVVIMRETLVALSYLHKSNVIHRDIKTANILIQSTGKVVLCDFGVSALLSSSHSKRTTFIGTPHYMAPEVLTSSSYDSKADIWSLGITMYEMATGSQPLAEIPQLQAITLIPKVKPPRLPEHIGSKDMKDFISYCLRELPTDRLPADELARSKWIKSSSKMPVSTLEELIARYDKWSQAGGIRQSLADPAPWELNNDKLHEKDELDDPSPWQFDTIRSRSDALVSRERADSDPSFSNSSARPPDSLRMLFGDDSFPSSSSDPFFLRLNGHTYEQPLLASNPSTASLPDLSRTLEDDSDATARLPRLHGHSRRLPQTHKQNLSVESDSGATEPLRISPKYREARNSRGLPDISIPPPDTILAGSLNSDETLTTSRGVPARIEDGRGDGTARPLRRRTSPTTFQFPRSLPIGRAQERQAERTPPSTASPRGTFHHQPAASVEYTRPPSQESPNFNISHSAHTSIAGASDGAVIRKPSLTRQRSVAVMETVSSVKPAAPAFKPLPPPLARGRTVGAPLPRSDIEPSSQLSRPGKALKDVLKLSPLPPAIFSSDVLPPSPSVQSPPIRAFTATGSSLGSTSFVPATAQYEPSSSMALKDEAMPVELPAAQHYSFFPSSASNHPVLPSLGSVLKPLDFNALLQSREETHTELARTIEGLTNVLQIIENGLSTVLTHIDSMEEMSDDDPDATTKPAPLSPIPPSPSPKPG